MYSIAMGALTVYFKGQHSKHSHDKTASCGDGQLFFGLGVGGGGRVGSVFTMFPWCEFIICVFPGIQPSVCSCQLAGCW